MAKRTEKGREEANPSLPVVQNTSVSGKAEEACRKAGFQVCSDRGILMFAMSPDTKEAKAAEEFLLSSFGRKERRKVEGTIKEVLTIPFSYGFRANGGKQDGKEQKQEA